MSANPRNATIATPPSPLLTSKLHLPRLHADLVRRERLLERLDAGVEGKLSLVTAPAGSGKTTLVGQWLTQRNQKGDPPSVAWVSLDAGDDDPIRFWFYVMTACRTFMDGGGETALEALSATARDPFGTSPLQHALDLWLNDLDTLAGNHVLVLEDYHAITSPRIHEALAFVVDHLPAKFHLVIMTRTEPPLPLARWRARGELNELHAADLRFTPKETGALLQRSLSVAVSADVVAHLDKHMEGWVAGMLLAVLALRGESDREKIERSLADFEGNRRHIGEFFVAEVLDAQPEPMRSFLLQTSILSRLTGALCGAVTGCDDGAQLLAEAERANLFVQRLDDDGEWYRYHPLFAEAMQVEAHRRLGDETMRACYGRAGTWYAQHGMRGAAVEATIAAREFARAASLIEQIVGTRHLHEMHDQQTLLHWIDVLPEIILGQHPRLCLRFAMLLLFSTKTRTQSLLARIGQLLEMAESQWTAEKDCAVLGEIGAFRALLSRQTGDLAAAGRYARQALPMLAEDEGQWRGTCLGLIAEEELLTGRPQAARKALIEAQAQYEIAGNTYATRASLITLGDIAILQGELHQAAELYRRVIATAGDDIFDKGRSLLGLAHLSYEWDALDVAEEQARESLAIGPCFADDRSMIAASLLLAVITFARGQTEEAMRGIHALLADLSPQTPP
ncbi:MAG TPA: hypothetical protein VKB76_17260, partial [Ktedonobacterales bacterium]|nr:hypothetical protein [Ktedonobacterales bacterium]